jgi:hypothetical protein
VHLPQLGRASVLYFSADTSTAGDYMHASAPTGPLQVSSLSLNCDTQGAGSFVSDSAYLYIPGGAWSFHLDSAATNANATWTVDVYEFDGITLPGNYLFSTSNAIPRPGEGTRPRIGAPRNRPSASATAPCT